MFGKTYILNGGPRSEKEWELADYWSDVDGNHLGFVYDGLPKKEPWITGDWVFTPTISMNPATKTISIRPQGKSITIGELYEYLKEVSAPESPPAFVSVDSVRYIESPAGTDSTTMAAMSQGGFVSPTDLGVPRRPERIQPTYRLLDNKRRHNKQRSYDPHHAPRRSLHRARSRQR